MKKIVFFFILFSSVFAENMQMDSVVIRGDNSSGPFRISRFEIDLSSLLVVLGNDTLSPKAHYRFVKKSNSIILDNVLPDTSFLKVKFRVVRKYLPKIFFNRDINNFKKIENKVQDTVSLLELPDNIAEVDNEQFLQVEGFKTFGISAKSNGNVSVNQSLQMQIQGQIAKGTQLSASLSDQNIPLQPEGTTRLLSEVDQARIDIRSPYIFGTLGNFYDAEELEYIRYRKKIQGISATVNVNGVSSSFSGASSRGTFYSYSFNGEEGKQGAYRLIGKDGNANIVILAGTESVFLDGVKMARGSNYDYVIDYASGTVTFNSRRPITAESEITVNYEYLEQDFLRTLVRFSSGYKKDLWNFKITGLQERDSRNDPLSFVLSDKDKNALSVVGDSKNARTGSLPVADIQTASEKGFYVQIDSADISFFKYYPPDSLDLYKTYTLYAPNFGEKEGGAYDTVLIYHPYNVQTIYRYVGEGNGNFEAGAVLLAPQSHRIMDLFASCNARGIKIEAEGAVSQKDKNTFSKIDDDDNMGFAGNVDMQYGMDNKKGFFVAGKFLSNDDNFRAFGTQTQSYEYKDRWGISLMSVSSAKKSGDIKLGWRTFGDTKIQTETGMLSMEQNNLIRFGINANIPILKGSRLIAKESEVYKNVRAENLGMHKDMVKLLVPKLLIKPYVGFEHEWNKKDTLGTFFAYGYRDLFVGMESDKIGLFSLKAKTSFVKNRISNSKKMLSGKDSITTIHSTGDISMNPWHGFSMNSFISHREVKKELGENRQTFSFDLAEMNLNYEPYNRGIVFRNNYKLNSNQLNSYRDRFVYAGGGLGTYAYDSVTGDYVPAENGDYKLLGKIVDTAETGREINLLSYLKIKPVNMIKTGGFLDDVTLLTKMELATQSPFSTKSVLNRYLPDWAFSSVFSDTVMERKTSFFQEIFFHPYKSLRLRFSVNPSIRESFFYGHEMQETMVYDVRGQNNFGEKTTIMISFKQETEQRNRVALSGMKTLNYDILNRKSDVEYNYRLFKSYSVGINTGVGISREDISNSNYLFYSFSPFVVKNFLERGRIKTEYTWNNVIGDGMLYYRMANGYSKGITHKWNISGEYTLGDNLLLNLYYLGRLNPGSAEAFQQADLNLRAYF